MQTENMVNFKVTKSNNLIQKTRYQLTLQEQKIIAYIVSQIEPEDTELKTYIFDIGNFCNICDINPKGAYASLRKTIKELADKSFWYKDEEKGEEILLRWFQGVKLYKDKGQVSIRISDDMRPFLLELKERFTSYAFYNIINFSSRYSIRIYELLRSFYNLGAFSVAVDDFKKMIDAENYVNFKDLRNRCLTPAIEEINKYTDIFVMYTEIRRGRKVYKLNFDISENSRSQVNPLLKL